MASLEGSIQLCGDGRCDSPGHSAKFMTYTFLCPDAKKIVHTEQVQVREVSKKSVRTQFMNWPRLKEFQHKSFKHETKLCLNYCLCTEERRESKCVGNVYEIGELSCTLKNYWKLHTALEGSTSVGKN